MPKVFYLVLFCFIGFWSLAQSCTGYWITIDPDNGKTYSCTIWLNDANKDKLNVRGYIGPFFRTQEWIRTDEIPIE